MIKIENTVVYGWETAIRGMRNPMNSWDQSDSEMNYEEISEPDSCMIGPKDYDLMKRLANAGPDHGKFMRMVGVGMDITAPLYWWKEFDTYKVGTVSNSCSTMHKLHEKAFTLEDFSHEHLLGEGIVPDHNEENPFDLLSYYIIGCLNFCRGLYIKTGDKRYWWQMIQLLPTSYNQRRTILLNYAVLRNMYRARKNHKLDEWRNFCGWIETLPYAELITGGDAE